MSLTSKPRLLALSAAYLTFGALAQSAGAQRTPTLASEVQRVSALVNSTYQQIHEHPELGKRETLTHELLLADMRKIGYTTFVESKRVPTAVIAVLDTKRPGLTIALRAEMDARPDTEPAQHHPHSQTPGVMHSCGHDAHAAMLLGAADVLWHNQNALSGKIVIVFQPAEEIAGGADDIVNEGILSTLGVQAMFAQHASPRMPVGTISISPGATLAGSNSFTLTVRGKDSHAAQPSDGSDVPGALATLVRGLIDLPARRLDISNRPAIISVTYMQTGDTTALTTLQTVGVARGTIRAFETIDPTPPSDTSIKTMIDQYLKGTAPGLRVTTELTLRRGSPVTVNDQTLFDKTMAPLHNVWPGTINTAPYRGMFSEDFAYYTQSIPSLYFGLGVAKDGLGMAGVHTTDFTIHPDALNEGVRLLVLTAQIATKGSVLLK
ncbi:MAG: M20 family metallopeptidase [Gemmatimonas sp.]